VEIVSSPPLEALPITEMDHQGWSSFVNCALVEVPVVTRVYAQLERWEMEPVTVMQDIPGLLVRFEIRVYLDTE